MGEKRALRLPAIEPESFPWSAITQPAGERWNEGDVRAEVARLLQNLPKMSLDYLAGRARGLREFALDAGHPGVAEELAAELTRVLGRDVLDGMPYRNHRKCEECGLEWIVTCNANACPNCALTRTVKLVAEARSEAEKKKDRVGDFRADGLFPLGFRHRVEHSGNQEATVTASSRPQVPFLPKLLCISPLTPPGTVQRLYLGTSIQGVGDVGLPIAVFQPQFWADERAVSRALAWRSGIVKTGVNINLQVSWENVREPFSFEAILWGEALPEWQCRCISSPWAHVTHPADVTRCLRCRMTRPT
jgi:hypothetical protein